MPYAFDPELAPFVELLPTREAGDIAEYAPPLRGEQHCYRRGTIDFENVRNMTWRNQGSPPSSDSTGEIDYGSIDSMSVIGGVYLLEGNWGEVEVQLTPPTVQLR